MIDQEMKKAVLENFEKAYGKKENVKAYFAPGRVNLIGEHTDYNGGHVFPCALTIGTYAAAAKRDDRMIQLFSLNQDKVGVVSFCLDDTIAPSESAGWTNYPMGVVWAFEKRGMKLDTGFDMVIYGNIPNGSGLSSSASLEVLTGFVLRDLYGFEVTNQDLALIGQYSENNFNGCNCGIMDQFASLIQLIFLLNTHQSSLTVQRSSLPTQIKSINLQILSTTLVAACVKKLFLSFRKSLISRDLAIFLSKSSRPIKIF